MIRILLVDDHPVVRQGIRSILMEHLQEAVVGEAGTAEDALRQAAGDGWDVVIADISMPRMSGLHFLKAMRRRHPNVPTLVLSMHPAAQFARRALRAGAAGYLTKDSPPEELVAAIEQARLGRRYVSPSADAGLKRWVARSATSPQESLSDREYQFLRMTGSGYTVSDIARDLGLSVKTVSTFRTRVLKKLGMRTSAQLIRYAIENTLLDS